MSGPISHDLAPTRRTLLTRLASWDNQESWREFFDTYWRLIYSFAVQSGLQDVEAQEVVQETLISVAGEFKNFKYDPAKGSFKSWLLLITRRRIADQMRKRYAAREVGKVSADDTKIAEEIESRGQQASGAAEAVWDEQWRTEIADAALARVRRKVKPQQYQIFEMYVIHGENATEVARAMGGSLVTVYLTKHRVSGLLREEAKRLEREMV